jgi:hypothetical protein
MIVKVTVTAPVVPEATTSWLNSFLSLMFVSCGIMVHCASSTCAVNVGNTVEVAIMVGVQVTVAWLQTVVLEVSEPVLVPVLGPAPKLIGARVKDVPGPEGGHIPLKY